VRAPENERSEGFSSLCDGTSGIDSSFVSDAPLLFSVVANALISVSAFVSLVLFFRSRSILQKPAVTLQRQSKPAIGSAASSAHDFNQPQYVLRTGNQHGTATHTAGRSIRQRGHGQSGENRCATGAFLDLDLGKGRVNPV
jgi:hypothetical protein